MPSEKRQRQDTGRMARLEEQRAADRRRQRTRQPRPPGLLLGGLIVAALRLPLFSRGDDDATGVATDGTATTQATGDTTARKSDERGKNVTVRVETGGRATNHNK